MTATEPVDPTKAVGRLLPEGWRVERTCGYDGGTMLCGGRKLDGWVHVLRVPHGETVDCVIETPLYGLTIQQPYASLIAHGIKTIETRGFQPRVVKPGDDLAIIAGATSARGFFPIANCHNLGMPITSREWRLPNGHHIDQADHPDMTFPHSVVVAVARFVEALPIVECSNGMDPCLTIHDGLRQVGPGQIHGHTMTQHGTRRDDQLPYGDYRPGRFGWLLDDIRRLPEPIPCTGFQGLRALPADVDAATRQAVQ